MNICSGEGRNRHDEIVFEGKECPCCILMGEVDGLADELNSAREELADIKKDQ